MDYPVIILEKKSKQYPKLLKHIADPPARLYCRGNVSLLNTECFAVVGTRSITPYGRDATQSIVPKLAKHFTIVSGMALGIDAVAQRATLDCGGKTIAVLGTAVENPSPRTNYLLAQDILKKDGLLISEYNKESKIFAYNWAIRDRIVSGLSKGVLIIEADEKSGSLITARLAGEQNRDVFAVPGNIFSSKSMGPHKLIRTGAKLVASAHDILEEYSVLNLNKHTSMSTTEPTHAVILAILETHGPLNIDSLVEKSGRDASEVMGILSLMELQDLVTQMAGGMYRKSD
ncbi:MAG: DNA-processing protein DprA [Patescibacteria group bacterium]